MTAEDRAEVEAAPAARGGCGRQPLPVLSSWSRVPGPGSDPAQPEAAAGPGRPAAAVRLPASATPPSDTALTCWSGNALSTF
jgi:hypothetical protein